MDFKICANCKVELPNNEKHFKLKTYKSGIQYYFSTCNKCVNEKSRINNKIRRDKIREDFGTVYAYEKLFFPHSIINNPKKKSNAKKYKEENKPYIVRNLEKGTLKKKKDREELNDDYIILLIQSKVKGISKSEILKHKDLIETYRLNIQLKRLLKNGK